MNSHLENAQKTHRQQRRQTREKGKRRVVSVMPLENMSGELLKPLRRKCGRRVENENGGTSKQAGIK